MRPISLCLTCLIILSAICQPMQVFSQTPDTIQPVPFVETWDSASFSTNGWTFPWMQGNWAIDTSEGNPAPCASFPNSPSQSNYIYALVSPWFDATGLTCDKIFLDFDVSLSSILQTGTEKLTVVLEYDTVATTLVILTNDASYSWKHLNYRLYNMTDTFFRIKFIASGQSVGRISKWELDNIAITRSCLPPEEIGGDVYGNCDWECFFTVTWSPPDCSLPLIEYSFIYDDNSWEDGLRGVIGDTLWIGNLFPISPLITGTMESIDVYFADNGTGSPQTLFIELFDTYGNSLGAPVSFFTPMPDYWINIPLPSISFFGPIYAMVKYDNLQSNGYYLACDMDGPYVSQFLAYMYDGTSWSYPTYWPGGAVFFVRGHAMIESDIGEDKRVTIAPMGITDEHSSRINEQDQLGKHESTPATKYPQRQLKSILDSSEVVGYNVYRWDYWWPDPGFIKINQTLILDTSYSDTTYCDADIYVTAVYNDGCESEPSEILRFGCPIGIPEESETSNLQISPNPADSWIEVECTTRIEAISLYDMTGRKHYHKEITGSFNLKVDLPWLSEGLYILKVSTEKGTTASRVMILH